MVLFNDYAAASCLIPAFNLHGNHVETMDGLIKQESFQHIQQGFTDANFFPCRRCASAKTILAESILRREHSPIQDSRVSHYIPNTWCSCSSQGSFLRGVRVADSLRHQRRSFYADQR